MQRLRTLTLTTVALLGVVALHAQTKKPAPAPPKPAPKAAPAKPAPAAAHTTPAARPGTSMAGRPGAPAARPAAERGPMAHPGPAGSHEVRTANGGAVRMRANGRPADFHDAHGMDIHHNLAGGGRRVSIERADHSRLVYERGRPGYIARPYLYHGHEFARRAYYFHGRAYNRFYNPYF